MGGVLDLNSLVLALEDHRMLSDGFAGTHGMDREFLPFCARRPHFSKGTELAHCLCKGQSSSARAVFLVDVVGLMNVDRAFAEQYFAEIRCGFQTKRHSKAKVGGMENRDDLGSLDDRLLLL